MKKFLGVLTMLFGGLILLRATVSLGAFVYLVVTSPDEIADNLPRVIGLLVVGGLFAAWGIKLLKSGKARLASEKAATANVAIVSAQAFQQTAREMGYAVQLPFKEQPHIAYVPLVIPDRPGISILYADFAESKLVIVTKSILKGVQDQREEKNLGVAEFHTNLFGMLEKFGAVQQADGTHRWDADRVRRRDAERDSRRDGHRIRPYVT